jgi:cold shock CspA family protein
MSSTVTTKRLTGRVTRWFASSGYGFVAVSGTTGAFVHVRDCENLDGWSDHLNEGDLVEFGVIETGRGLRACRVWLVERAAAYTCGRCGATCPEPRCSRCGSVDDEDA